MVASTDRVDSDFTIDDLPPLPPKSKFSRATKQAVVSLAPVSFATVTVKGAVQARFPGKSLPQAFVLGRFFSNRTCLTIVREIVNIISYENERRKRCEGGAACSL